MTRLLAFDAIVVALVITSLGAVLGPVAVVKGRRDWLGYLYAAVYTNFVLVTVSTLALIYGLVTHDFSISYVAQVGSRATPTFYTIISLWGALEGSIVFWAWVLAMYAAAVVWFNRKREGNLVPYAAVTLLVVTLFFHILLVGPANPFQPVFPVPFDGPGPNPLLQNHILMGVHPPLLYLGYVGLTVPFAFAVGAMLSGEVANDDWIRLTRRWTITAWGFLTAAIIAGMWWSYEVLGWGGYWAWDPVENASFIPWLTCTAYLHSVMVQERRGMLKLWNLNLMVGTFVLTILGTFLTRSGIISSVHAFTQGTIGYYFLGFIAVVLVSTLFLVAGNSDKLASEGRLDAPMSRETAFLLQNLFFTVFMLTVLIGTLFPLVAEAVRGVKVSVGTPFFNKMSLPLMVALLFLMGVGPALPWKKAAGPELKGKLLPGVVLGVLFMLAALFAGARNAYSLLAFLFSGFALGVNLDEFVRGANARVRAHGELWPVALSRLVGGNRRRYGGYVSHIGIVLVALGVTASSTFKKEQEATLKPGESITVAGHTLRFKTAWGREEPQRQVIGATMEWMDGDRVRAVIEPRMNYYPTSQQPVPTPEVKSTLRGDIYLNLMAFKQDGSNVTVKVIWEPLVPWIWLGGFVLCFGAIIGVLPQRKRYADAPSEPAPSAPQLAEGQP
ncbi:MAG: heme lyase CcmF/NrfE family subunit [Gemmatimonadota bacterium]|nr:heme lyase CcmF/NrfE family subunit [Gemmatimonadota bacterium]